MPRVNQRTSTSRWRIRLGALATSIMLWADMGIVLARVRRPRPCSWWPAWRSSHQDDPRSTNDHAVIVVS